MNNFVVALLLVVLHMGSSSVAAPSNSPKIPLQIYNANDHGPYNMPDSCPEDNFCFEKGVDYPDEKIEILLKDMRELPVENPKLPIEFQDVEDRDGNNPKNNSDCPANTTYINKPIYYIVDTNDNVRVVVQSQKLEQIYSVKWCLKPGRITEDTEHFLAGSDVLIHFNVECVNTYMDFEFFVLNDDYEPTIEIAKVKDGIPVCCRCRYSNL